ncbi:MAG: TRAP transporter small permease subunit [Rhodovarius sp.]|nr:TRAP transporter small permease [Rhodovarius sp.]MCX7931086.1 TRAP transporter small permease [Rhodovarius sp.]MDW8315431.1 TRAP transporter small permease subunit [Rhodovarius sp.]
MAEEMDMAALEAAPAAAGGSDPVRWLLDALAAIGTIWTFGLMLLICADVIGRSFLNAPITGVAEIAAHSVVGIVFLQIGATIYCERMTRADFLIERLRRALPRLGLSLEALFLLVGGLVMAFIAQAAWPGLWNAVDRREFFGVQGLFTVPTWPFRALIVLGGAAGALAYATLLLRTLWRLLRPLRG